MRSGFSGQQSEPESFRQRVALNHGARAYYQESAALATVREGATTARAAVDISSDRVTTKSVSRKKPKRRLGSAAVTLTKIKGNELAITV
jgi:hypothetical protein